MDDPTDYYLGVGISVIIISYCIIMTWWNMLCRRYDDFDESYTETGNDPV